MVPRDAILCESCGYDITTLEPSVRQNVNTPCPECGLRMIASLPEHRYGSPWQRRQSLSNLLNTASRVVTAPNRAWFEVRIDSRANRKLLNRSLLLVSFAWPAAYGLPGIINALLHRASPALALQRGFRWLLMAGALLLILHTLCAIESLGLRFFARRRGWRTDRHIALAVIAHASIGWWLGPFLFLALLLIIINIAAPDPASNAHLLTPVAALFFLHFLIPLLAFEILVYTGFRALRFANYPRPKPAPHNAPPTKATSSQA